MIKKFFFLYCLFLLTVLMAMEPTVRTRTYELNFPFSWLVRLDYNMEFKINDSLSLNPGLRYQNLWVLYLATGVWPQSLSVYFALNYYPQHKALRGFYWGPKISLGYGGYLVKVFRDNPFLFSGGIVGDVGLRMGYQWILKKGIVLDLCASYSLGVWLNDEKIFLSQDSTKLLIGGPCLELYIGKSF